MLYIKNENTCVARIPLGDVGNVIETINHYVGTTNGTNIVDGYTGLGRSFGSTVDNIIFGVPIIPAGKKSVRFKMKLATTPTVVQPLLCTKTASNSSGFYIGLTANGSFNIIVSNGGTNVISIAAISVTGLYDGNWHDILFTWTGDTTANGVNLYLDNLTTPIYSGTATGSDLIGDSLSIGKQLYNANVYFAGSLNMIEIYNDVVQFATAKYLIRDGNNIVSVSGGTANIVGVYPPADTLFITQGMDSVNIPNSILTTLSKPQLLVYTTDTSKSNLTITSNVELNNVLSKQLSNPRVLVYTDNASYSPKLQISGSKKSNYSYNVQMLNPDAPLKNGALTSSPTNESINVSSTFFKSATNPYTFKVSVTQEDGSIINSTTSAVVYDTEPSLLALMNGPKLSIQIGDPEGNAIKFRIEINGKKVYPSSGDFTPLQSPIPLFEYTFKSTEYTVGEINNVVVTAQDEYGKQSVVTTSFLGDYFGLMFMDENMKYYSTDMGELLQYLDFGTITLGQTTEPRKVIVKNNHTFNIKEIAITINNTLPNITVELSKTLAPFIPTSSLTFTSIYQPQQQEVFFIRLSSEVSRTAIDGVFKILAKAQPE